MKSLHYTDIAQYLFRSSLIVFIGAAIGHILNYIFGIVMGRMLTPEDFGDVAVLVAFVMFLSIPASIIGLFVARLVAVHNNDTVASTSMFRSLRIRKRGVIWGSVAVAVFILSSPLLSSRLDLTLSSLLLFTPTILISLLTSIHRGVLQGTENYRGFTFLSVIDAIGKLVFSLIFVLAGYGVEGVALAFLITSTITFAVSWYITRTQLPAASAPTESIPHIKAAAKGFWSVAAAVLFLFLITHIDIVLVKLFLSEEDAGSYAALSLIGKIILYGAPITSTVMFPATAFLHTKSARSAGRVLHMSLLFTISAAALVVGAYVIFPSQIVTVMFQDAYTSIVPLVGIMGMIALFWATTTIYVSYFIAKSSHAFLFPLGMCVVLQIVGIYLFHTDILSILQVLLVVSILLTGSLTGLHLKEHRSAA